MFEQYFLGQINFDELYEQFNDQINLIVHKELENEGKNMWVYWKEQCKYCKNCDNCEYISRVKELITKLSEIEKSIPEVYGTLNWKCNYYVTDEEKYYKDNIGECDDSNC